MMENVTAGATGALGYIVMTGYDSSDLTGMMEKVTAGATGALGNIVMTGYSSDNLTGMMEKVTAGATGALGNITMDGYDSSDLSGMVTKITSGATGALGNISMDGYDSNDLSGMVTKITSGATGALGNISMEGYSSDNVSAFTTTITSSVTDSLSNITMSGYNPNTDNLSSSIAAGTTAGLTFSGTGIIASGIVTGDDNLSGIFNMSYWGQEPSGGCIDNSTAVAAFKSLSALPSDTLGFKKQIIITSSTTFTQSMQYYSDASCAKLTGYLNLLFDNLLVGDSLSGLNAGSNPAKPTTAKKISYNHPSMKLKSNTATTTAWFLSTIPGISMTTGNELVIPTSESIVNIAETGAMPGSSKTYLFIGSPQTSTYPTDWTNASVYWQE